MAKKRTFQFEACFAVAKNPGGFEDVEDRWDLAKAEAIEFVKTYLPDEPRAIALVENSTRANYEFLECDSSNISHGSAYFQVIIEYRGDKEYTKLLDKSFNQQFEV